MAVSLLGTCYSLQPSDYVLIQGGRRQQGRKASRALITHRVIYERHPSGPVIVFVHPVNATAFSVTASVFDARTIAESYVFFRDVERVP